MPFSRFTTQTSQTQLFKVEIKVKVGYFQLKVILLYTFNLRFSSHQKETLQIHCIDWNPKIISNSSILLKTTNVYPVLPCSCCLYLYILANLQNFARNSVMESEFLFPHRQNTIWLSLIRPKLSLLAAQRYANTFSAMYILRSWGFHRRYI